jgi:hypothetical protein
MEWHNPQPSWKKKFRKTPSAGSVMISVFWNFERVILVDTMLTG